MKGKTMTGRRLLCRSCFIIACLCLAVVSAAFAEVVQRIPDPVDFPYWHPLYASPPISDFGEMSMSDDGNFVALQISYYNKNGTIYYFNQDSGILLYDRINNTTNYISMEGNIGYKANADSWGADISGDGTHVAYVSTTRLFPGDANYEADIFVYSRLDGSQQRISVPAAGGEGCTSDDRYWGRTFVGSPSISYDGRYVAFASSCSNFVPGDTNKTTDVFLRDRLTGSLQRINRAFDGSETGYPSGAPVVSADGQKVAFVSADPGIVEGDDNGMHDIFIYDVPTGTTTRAISIFSPGNTLRAFDMSADGRFVVFSSLEETLVPEDVNGYEDVFVHDVELGATSLVSVSSDGFEGNGHSGVFSGYPRSVPRISPDGRFVAFVSEATTLVDDDTNGVADVFIHDRSMDKTVRVGMGLYGAEPNGYSTNFAMDGTGQIVSFVSRSKNLVVNNSDPNDQAFVTDLSLPTDFDLDDDGFDYQSDCNDRIAAIFPGATEVPYNGVDENCNGMDDDDDVDKDGYLLADDCDDARSDVNPGMPETYNNGIDDNCNGIYDDYDRDNDLFDATVDCNDYNATIYPGAPEVKLDGIDQDCNYYDLTIEIVATYKENKDRLIVDATSRYYNANLFLEGFGPMTFNGKEWSIIVDNAGGKQATVTVSGVEGSETAPVESN